MAVIPIGIPSSGLDIFLKLNGILADPTSISYEIKDSDGTFVGSGLGFQRSTGHYDARNTTISAGFNNVGSWSITWTFVSPAAATGVVSESFTVAAGMVHSFVPKTQFETIRDLVKDDIGLTTQYTDDQYENFLIKSLRRINRKLNFVGKTSQMSFNTDTGTISPSPNDTVLDIVILQIECLIVKNIRSAAVRKGIRVRDGDSEIDTTAGFTGMRELISDTCGELEKAIQAYWAGIGVPGGEGAAKHGEAITYANMDIIEDLDHNGQGGGSRNIRSPFDDSFNSSIGDCRNPC